MGTCNLCLQSPCTTRLPSGPSEGFLCGPGRGPQGSQPGCGVIGTWELATPLPHSGAKPQVCLTSPEHAGPPPATGFIRCRRVTMWFKQSTGHLAQARLGLRYTRRGQTRGSLESDPSHLHSTFCRLWSPKAVNEGTGGWGRAPALGSGLCQTWYVTAPGLWMRKVRHHRLAQGCADHSPLCSEGRGMDSTDPSQV